MSIIACAEEDCDRARVTREYCHRHYEYKRSHGLLPRRLCKGCGSALPKVKGTIYFCSQDCRPVCAVAGCVEKRKNREWCEFHFTRWNLTGDTTTPLSKRSYAACPPCEFKGCLNDARRAGLCSGHYTQKWRGKGLSPLAYKSKSSVCGFCGGPSGVTAGYRRACSPRCTRMLNKHGGPLPDTYECIICEDQFPFIVPGQRRRKYNTKMCPGCRRHSAKHGYSARQLANRDGTTCTLCLEPVDMTLRHPDLMRGSVDHIIPTSLGGSNEPENVALAHLHCNIKKNNRVDVTAM